MNCLVCGNVHYFKEDDCPPPGKVYFEPLDKLSYCQLCAASYFGTGKICDTCRDNHICDMVPCPYDKVHYNSFAPKMISIPVPKSMQLAPKSTPIVPEIPSLLVGQTLVLTKDLLGNVRVYEMDGALLRVDDSNPATQSMLRVEGAITFAASDPTAVGHVLRWVG